VAPDVFELGIEQSEPLSYIPGQYCSVQFRGYPARCFSPTAPLAWPSDASLLRFHIRQVPNGRVSPALGNAIGLGHRVKVNGPFGTAFLRPYRSKRLVLVASGTGFAPIWAVAEAAIREQPRREIVLLVGGKTLESLYMIKALCRLALFPNVVITHSEMAAAPLVHLIRITPGAGVAEQLTDFRILKRNNTAPEVEAAFDDMAKMTVYALEEEDYATGVHILKGMQAGLQEGLNFGANEVTLTEMHRGWARATGRLLPDMPVR